MHDGRRGSRALIYYCRIQVDSSGDDPGRLGLASGQTRSIIVENDQVHTSDPCARDTSGGFTTLLNNVDQSQSQKLFVRSHLLESGLHQRSFEVCCAWYLTTTPPSEHPQFIRNQPTPLSSPSGIDLSCEVPTWAASSSQQKLRTAAGGQAKQGTHSVFPESKQLLVVRSLSKIREFVKKT